MKRNLNLLGMVVLAIAASIGCTSQQPTAQPHDAKVDAFCAQTNTNIDKIENIFKQASVKIERLKVEAERNVARQLVEKTLADTRTLRHDVCSAANLSAAEAARDADIPIVEADAKAAFEYNNSLKRGQVAQVSQEQAPQSFENELNPSPALQSARNAEARRLKRIFGVTSTQIAYGTLWIDVNSLETEHDYNNFICKNKLDQRLFTKLRFNFTTDHAMDIPLPVLCQ